MRARSIAALALVAVLGASASLATARPIPPEVDSCRTTFHEGPVATSCRFTYGGGRVWAFGATVSAGAPATIAIDVIVGETPNQQILFTCSSSQAGPVSGAPAATCARRSGFLPVAEGTTLWCRQHGPGQGLFGCLST